MMTLSTAKIGRKGTILYLKTEDEALTHKLMALGIMPGIDIQLEQKFPSYIIKIGRTRATLDQETAQRIYIQ
ncbi:FeoA family protein [Planktothrix tepida]|uniref:FeoA family protein n=2 Tax=Planktothrix TaxID=54304 RepID=A0A1J1LEV3_9CYAN|nr:MULTISPECIES: FeoA family protein [Planktothrix]CAD5923461.1 FeoA family protein [Planktothrix tepida]CAD5982258.1 FeoA family protein [Planktothrix pseudagardhii]CUR31107.1 FeoA family protein [Planktothrix tepida PCC 9214]